MIISGSSSYIPIKNNSRKSKTSTNKRYKQSKYKNEKQFQSHISKKYDCTKATTCTKLNEAEPFLENVTYQSPDCKSSSSDIHHLKDHFPLARLHRTSRISCVGLHLSELHKHDLFSGIYRGRLDRPKLKWQCSYKYDTQQH